MTKLDAPTVAGMPPEEGRGSSPSPERSLRSLMLRGSIWTLSGYGASQVLRLAGNLVLTRLLFPEAFGLSALVGVFMAGLAMFSDVGIGPSIIRSHRGGDPDFLSTAWTVQVVRGLILWVGAAALSWPLARLYGQPQLLTLLPVAGLSALINGLGSTSLFTCSRGLAVGRLNLLELITQAVTLAVTSIYAILQPTVWALVVGGLVGSSVRVALSHTLLGRSPDRFHWDKAAAREISGLARWILINSAITFLAMQFDRLWLGRLVSMKAMGLYAIAAGLAQIPRDVMSRLSGMIIFPALAKLLRDPGDAKPKVRSLHRILVFGAAPISGLVIAAGPFVIDALYDERYRDAGRILSLLTVGTWIQVFTVSYYSVILAGGKPSSNGFGMATRLAVMLLLVEPVFRGLGVQGVAALTSLSELGVAGWCFYGAYRLGLSFPWVDVQAVAVMVATFLASHLILSMAI